MFNRPLFHLIQSTTISRPKKRVWERGHRRWPLMGMGRLNSECFHQFHANFSTQEEFKSQKLLCSNSLSDCIIRKNYSLETVKIGPVMAGSWYSKGRTWRCAEFCPPARRMSSDAAFLHHSRNVLALVEKSTRDPTDLSAAN